ncbi:thermonuclease family protein [Ciceribacter sp. L1K22]|uniref:thermonuclease family protein n=1 Tax=Ciceribacter sp. L1K22 TaxID=2820275 RepID=UPI001AEFB82B|nr:thermonuclease family protein [Ciceribacter sp. L1K22]
MLSLRHITALLLALALPVQYAESRQRLSGPVTANLLEVIDGDTLLVEATPWPDHRIITYVRLRGIDAPELRSSCFESRRRAIEAKDVLKSLVPDDATLELTDIAGDKYYGRIVAAVRLKNGQDLGSAMLSAGLARPYDGGRKEPPLC